MKKLTLLFLFALSISSTAQAQKIDYHALDEKYQDKVATLDAVVKTLYEVISGEKGEERNEDLLRYLFHPEAKLIASGKRENGNYGARYVTMDEYADKSLKWMLENGFYEIELHRVVEQFGHIAHVFSTYETKYKKEDKKPFMRGINSFQLMNTGKRWVVISLYFTQETKENPIPKKYLPSE
ncbi:hypothetical protein [Flagellimonas nanhaiensis]|uniref:Nuclear transport factor 2 family protein n=1 Tax=Flagellimonas nanhaiensis TaxID=2292706 RepID=A0A371JVT1_9FLAO|nr:hypothetical protein [Allomuricauda nanhaiensis]RDY61935.1 hypothetical protein DX873_07270 [Allomuricauda nanhaiensis]